MSSFGNNGQSAMEYMMIIAFSLLIVTPIYLFVTDQTYQTRADLQTSILQDSLRSVADSANMVYTQGYPARTTTELHLPDGMENVSLVNSTIRARVRVGDSYSDYHGFSDAELSGELPQTSGSYIIKLKATEEGVVNVSY